ncbi:MAG TPA: hypothetical protein VMT34_17810 [Aggregatilineales bacterium]|nr:hypothetical protein [Aggregatilineales bacterium]
MADTEKRLTLRMLKGLHDEIVQLAKQDMRSVHAEILVLLREAIAARHGANQGSHATGAVGKSDLEGKELL